MGLLIGRLVLVFLFLAVFPLPAETLDPAAADALQKTQALLLDPQARKNIMLNDPKAASMDAQVKSLAGSDQNTQAIYALAASILGNLANSASGDPEKMMELIQKAQKDPAAFAKGLTKEQKDDLSSIASKIPNPSSQKLP
jgi:hypothetical protein